MKIKITFVKAMLISITVIVLWALMPAFQRDSSIEATVWYKAGGVLLMLSPVLIVIISVRKELKFAVNISRSLKGKRGISKNRRQAEAEILALNENSKGDVLTANDQPVVDFKLRIYDGEKPPYEVSVDSIVPRLAVPRLLPGTKIPIFIDLKDDKKIVLDIEHMPKE